jgi:hypothetical protein
MMGPGKHDLKNQSPSARDIYDALDLFTVYFDLVSVLDRHVARHHRMSNRATERKVGGSGSDYKRKAKRRFKPRMVLFLMPLRVRCRSKIRIRVRRDGERRERRRGKWSSFASNSASRGSLLDTLIAVPFPFKTPKVYMARIREHVSALPWRVAEYVKDRTSMHVVANTFGSHQLAFFGNPSFLLTKALKLL